MPDFYGEIARLETEIESLSDELERCRKWMTVGRVCCLVGGIMVLLTALGRAGSLSLVFGIAAVLGGIALFGSSRSTRDQVTLTIKAREAQRAEMINRLELREI